MDINLSISAAPAITTNYLVVTIYEASSPSTVVDYQAFAAPHTSPRNISFTNVNSVVHIVKIFENATNTPGGTIRHQFIYDPSFANAEIRDDLFLHVGITAGMVAGATSYADPTLDGWNYSIELRQSYGTLEPGTEWDKTTSPVGWILLIDGYTFQPDEVYVLHFQPKITTVTPASPPIVSKIFDEVLLVDDTIALDNTVVGKAVWISGINPSMEVTLPDITTVLTNRIIPFFSQGGAHINAVIKTFGAQKIDWLTGNLSEVVIGKSEHIWLFKWVDPLDSSIYNWKVLQAEGNFKTVGEKVFSDLTTELNTVFADGSLLDRSAYKRLWNYVQSLDASDLVSDATWGTGTSNKGKYSTGDGSTTFRIPQLYATGYLRGVDGVTRKSGSFQDHALLSHKHEQTIGTLVTTLFGRGIARLIGRYNGTVNSQTDLTGVPCDDSGVAVAADSENRTKNTGQYILIRS
jgi:hypothetical protein